MASTEIRSGGSELGVAFRSILFDEGAPSEHGHVVEPDFFRDLNLDQVVSSVLAGRADYELESLFYQPLRRVHEIHYRHEVVRDLQCDPVRARVREFAQRTGHMRDCLAMVKKLHYPRQRQRWLLDAIREYCGAVSAFADSLAGLELGSRALEQLRDYTHDYVRSERFASLESDTRERESDLAAVSYTVHIRGRRIRVARYEGDADMGENVERTFAKFNEGALTDHRARLGEQPDMNHIEAQILDLVAKLHPDVFAELEAYCDSHRDYLDATIERVDRELQFYLAYLEHIAPMAERGLAFSLPAVSETSKEVRASQTFDLALAGKLRASGGAVVCNDLYLTGPERVLVVSGPNNGGKTTFARTFGQLHYLASLGLPVAGSDVAVLLPDRVFTHFEREEDIQTLRGKFEDELFRIHAILERATGDSVLIMNESFGSTALDDALLVGTEVMRAIIELDALCVFVTFVDELASLGESTVSMMSTVDPADPAVRTYKVVRKPADGLAYAAAIADKYGLSYVSLSSRLAR